MVRQREISLHVARGRDEPLHSCGAECAAGQDYQLYKADDEERIKRNEERNIKQQNEELQLKSQEELRRRRGGGAALTRTDLMEAFVEVIQMMIEGKGCVSFVNEVALHSKPQTPNPKARPETRNPNTPPLDPNHKA